MKEFSTPELADRWYDLREVTNLAGKYVTCLLLKREGEIFDRFWSSASDVCLTFNDGRYMGPKAVADYYKKVAEITATKSGFLKKLFPNQLGGFTDEEAFGVGQLQSLPLTTPVVEIASDGKTAKGIWNIQGSDNGISELGPLSFWSVGWLCIDFIKENDDWKIWHLFYAQELNAPMGESWVAPKMPEPVPEFAELAELKLPDYTEKGTFYTAYDKDRPFTAPPAIPQPYETFAATFSYGV